MTDGKKDSFIVRKKYRKQIQKLSVDQRLNLLEDIFLFQTEGEYHEEDGAVSMLMSIMIEEWEKDNEKYLEVCKTRSKCGKLGGAKKGNKNAMKTWENNQNNQKPPKQTKQADYDYDNDNDNSSMMLNYISSNEEIEQSSSGNKDINNLIDQIKLMCNGLGIAYDKQKERQFAKHILTAKDFGNFAENIGQGRVEFALNILKASFQIKFRKGICSGPMKIYQNYADVYNETLKQHSKNSKNLIQSF